MPENNTTPTPEELQEEQGALAEVKDDELRSEIATSLGLEDNDENKELIDKVFSREKTSRGKLSKAIGQKIDWRKKASGTNPNPPAPKTETAKPLSAEEISKQTEAATRKTLDEEYLEESDYSEAIKDIIRQEAARTGVSARKAAKSEFVVFKIGQEKSAKAADEAAKNGSHRGKTASTVDTSKPLNPSDYDMSTEDGRKAWRDARKAHENARAGK